jgi:cytochrome c553
VRGESSVTTRLRGLAFFALVCSTLSLVAFAPGARAGSDEPPDVVVRVCSACHGIDGNAPSPIVPRLGALSAAYIEAQLRSLTEGPPEPVYALTSLKSLAGQGGFVGVTGDRIDPGAREYMWGPAALLSDAERKEVAAWYAAQPAAPGIPGRSELIERGRQIYENGVPSAAPTGIQTFHNGEPAEVIDTGVAPVGVAPCRSCHGDQGQGVVGLGPRVAGQYAVYLVRQLEVVRTQEGPRAEMMRNEVKTLSHADERAVAEYMQSL